MKTKIFVVVIAISSFIVQSCKNNSTDELQKQVAELQKSNKEKDKKLTSLVSLLSVMAVDSNHFDHSGIWNFFNAPEFWQNTYGVNPSGCSVGCSNDLRNADYKCDQEPDPALRKKCKEEASKNYNTCIKNCTND